MTETKTLTCTTDNCDYETAQLDPYQINSIIHLRLTFPQHIPSVQSRIEVRSSLTALIRQELNRFAYLTYGPVWLDMTWFLDAASRQETDVTGDLDNITKPIIDSLCGLEGLMIDDSQIKSIYTEWLAKNHAIKENVLQLSVRFFGNDIVKKKTAYLFQYTGPMCFVADLDPLNPTELAHATLFARAKLSQRKSAESFRDLGANVDFPLVASQKDFHRTRLKNIPPERIIRLRV